MIIFLDWQNYNTYTINADLEIKSNTNFPIASALVIMEWPLDYYTSISDSGYTDSNGEINLQAQTESNYLLNETPQIFFYVSSSGFQTDTIVINGDAFNNNMLDTLTNQYIQDINQTIYLVPN